jgi:hypothetical protein
MAGGRCDAVQVFNPAAAAFKASPVAGDIGPAPQEHWEMVRCFHAGSGKRFVRVDVEPLYPVRACFQASSFRPQSWQPSF